MRSLKSEQNMTVELMKSWTEAGIAFYEFDVDGECVVVTEKEAEEQGLLQKINLS